MRKAGDGAEERDVALAKLENGAAGQRARQHRVADEGPVLPGLGVPLGLQHHSAVGWWRISNLL